MTPIELTGFSVLWVVFLSLTALVALLYRQVERAYRRSAAMQASGLRAGNAVPDLEVLAKNGTEPFRLAEDDALALLTFVTSECDSCRRLLDDLRAGPGPVSRRVVLVHGETTPELQAAMSELEMYWLANPVDAVRDFRVMLVPFVYVVRGRTVLGSGAVASGPEVSSLVEGALESERTASAAENGAGTPVVVGGRE
jgi:hypothetical protein